MRASQTISACAIGPFVLLAGCALQPSQVGEYPNNYPISNAPAYNTMYGVVDSIQVVQANTGGSSRGGGYTGRTAATAADVASGALVGNQIQRNNQQTRDVYQVGIRLDNGSYQAMMLDSVGDLQRVATVHAAITRAIAA